MRSLWVPFLLAVIGGVWSWPALPQEEERDPPVPLHEEERGTQVPRPWEGHELLIEPPELVLLNGRIYTGDPNQPVVEALAMGNGLIQAVGDSRAIRSIAGEETRRIDLAGRFACPGFVDAHAHISGLGRARDSLDLVGTRSFQEVARKVKARVAGSGKGEWITGRGWDQNDWEEKVLPTHAPLTEVAPENPTWVVRIGGHAGVANQAALEVAGIGKSTPDPEGGRIHRDPVTAEPTGLLVDAAISLLTRHIPARSVDQIREDILRAQTACLQVGLTEVHDAGIDAEEIRIYKALDEAGLLKIRIYGMASGDLDALRDIFAGGPILPARERRFTLRAVKAVADGALGSRGAALLADYSDEPGNRGLLTTSREDLLEIARWAVEANIQVCTHAIGDAAVRMTLDVYEECLPKEGSPRFRVEHAQVVSPEDVPRFRRLGVIPSMQPTHCTSDMPWAGDRLGPERLAGAYAWRSILETGARIPGGSDFPVESENPLWGIYAGVTRQDHQGRPEGGWRPAERMTREELVRSFTIDAAFAAFEEESKGTLSVGKWADIVVLDRDVLTVPPPEILETRIFATIIGGEVVFRAK